jgi:hypothetical protein
MGWITAESGHHVGTGSADNPASYHTQRGSFSGWIMNLTTHLHPVPNLILLAMNM